MNSQSWSKPSASGSVESGGSGVPDRLLGGLAELIQQGAPGREPREIFRAFRRFIFECLPGSSLLISLYDPARKLRTCAYAYSEGREEDPALFPALPLTESPGSHAIETGREIITEDLLESLQEQANPTIGFTEDRVPRSSIAVPMQAQGEIVGVVEVQSLEPSAYQAHHLPPLRLAADLAALMIQSRRSGQMLQQEMQVRQSLRMESVGQLAAGVAHAFNNLLTIVQGYAHLLLANAGDRPQDCESLQKIISASERAGKLTRQLLLFSGRQQANFERLDLNAALRRLAPLLDRVAGPGVRCEIRTAQALPPVMADAGMLEQVLVNLAANAADAMPSGGELLIGTAVEAAGAGRPPQAGDRPFVRLTVADTGTGMDAETRERIFDPFFTTKEVGKGTGLGLAMVYGIIQQHEGWIEVATEPGKGARFDIFLPAIAAPVQEPLLELETPPETSAHRANERTILLVEDEEAVRSMAATILDRAGYRVLAAASGPEALRIWQQHQERIDLLVTDLVMPEGMSGTDLARQIKRQRPDLPVVLSSGYSVNFSSAEFPVTQGYRFMPKPYSMQILMDTVSAALGR